MSTPTVLSTKTFVFAAYDQYNLTDCSKPFGGGSLLSGSYIVLIDPATIRALAVTDDPLSPTSGTSYACFKVTQGYSPVVVTASLARALGNAIFADNANLAMPFRDCLIPGSPAYIAVDGGGGVAHLAGGGRRLFPVPTNARDSYRIYPPSWDVGATVASSCSFPEDVNLFAAWTDYQSVYPNEGIRSRLRFDLHPGYYIVNPDGAMPPTLAYSLTVDAQESVTVPAGTFSAYRASIRSESIRSQSGGLGTGRITRRAWPCPSSVMRRSPAMTNGKSGLCLPWATGSKPAAGLPS